MSYAFFADVLFVLVFLGFTILGFRRGLVKSIARSFSLVLSFTLTFLIGGLLADVLERLFVKPRVYLWVLGAIEDAFESGGNANLNAFISRLPRFLVGDEMRAQLSALLEQGALARASEALSTPVSAALSAVLGYAISFLLSFIALRFLFWGASALIEKIPPLGSLNRLLGGAWGALAGSLCLLAAAFVIKLLFRDTEVYSDTLIVKGFCDCPLLQF